MLWLVIICWLLYKGFELGYLRNSSSIGWNSSICRVGVQGTRSPKWVIMTTIPWRAILTHRRSIGFYNLSLEFLHCYRRLTSLSTSLRGFLISISLNPRISLIGYIKVVLKGSNVVVLGILSWYIDLHITIASLLTKLFSTIVVLFSIIIVLFRLLRFFYSLRGYLGSNSIRRWG